MNLLCFFTQKTCGPVLGQTKADCVRSISSEASKRPWIRRFEALLQGALSSPDELPGVKQEVVTYQPAQSFSRDVRQGGLDVARFNVELSTSSNGPRKRSISLLPIRRWHQMTSVDLFGPRRQSQRAFAALRMSLCHVSSCGCVWVGCVGGCVFVCGWVGGWLGWIIPSGSLAQHGSMAVSHRPHRGSCG